ncbi:DHH family phosphoesterase [Candidatus Woesearchaeota archaeon]|nr:DHH family phosphoesterase [Candidatus Woesearchaeota archaeon]
MDRYEKFTDSVRKAAEELSALDKTKPIRIISHIDADGIAACAIISKALSLKNFQYSATIVKQTTKGIIYDLAHEKNETYIFLDLGSAELNSLKDTLKEKKIFIFDHHKINGDPRGIVFVNPEEFGISGSTELSASGVAYLIYKELTKKKNMAHVAFLGAIGDFQEHLGLSELNLKILNDAKKEGLIKVSQGLRIAATEATPVHKAIEFCYFPVIPDVTGSETGAVKFLDEIGVAAKRGYKWKRLMDLTDKEAKTIGEGIVKRRNCNDKLEQVYGDVYILQKEKRESITKDAFSYMAMIDACGRMEKASVGLGCCLGDETSKLRGASILNRYKRELMASLQWVNSSRKNKESKSVIEDTGYLIINAKYKLRETIISSLSSILTLNPELDGKIIMIIGKSHDDDMTKVSLRANNRKDVDLKKVLELMIMPVKGHCGGHKYAAGGRFSKELEEEFIENAKRVLDKFSKEEKVN